MNLLTKQKTTHGITNEFIVAEGMMGEGIAESLQ